MAGLAGDAHDRIDGAVAGRHDEATGDTDQQRKPNHRPIGEPVGEEQAGQGQRAQSGENVEIEQDAAPVAAFGQHAGQRQKQHHRRRQGRLGDAQPFRALAEGEGDDAGKQGGLQSEAEEPAGDQCQIGPEGGKPELPVTGEGIEQGQGYRLNQVATAITIISLLW